MDAIVYRKGLDAAKKFSKNGGWKSFDSFLDDSGLTRSDCASAWWETLEVAPNIPKDANFEEIPVFEFVHGRAFPETITAIIWGAHQEVRIASL